MYNKNNFAVNNISYEVILAPNGSKRATVHKLDDTRCRVAHYNVDLEKKICNCHHWQQSGVPCFHAIIVNRFMKICKFTVDDFYPWCHNQRLKDMFTSGGDSFNTVFPTEDDLFKIVNDESLGNLHKMIPVLVTIFEDNKNNSLVSSKRYASQGEKSHNGVYKTTKTRVCPICGVKFSSKSRHPTSACRKNLKDKKMIEPLITPLN